MIFSTEFWPISLLWALIAAAVAAGIAALGGSFTSEGRNRRETRTVSGSTTGIFAGGVSFLVGLLAMRFLMYYLQPPFQGSWCGYFPVLLASLVPALAIGMIVNGYRSTRGWMTGIASILVLFGVVAFQNLYSTVGPTNAQRYAQLANVREAEAGDDIPPTDPNKMIQVDKNIAAFKGQTALTSTKENLGSRFKIAADSYVLQSVGGHRYWIAPLIFANKLDHYWGPLVNNGSESPGYVVVDAQNPDKDASLKLGFQISVFKDGNFGQNLYRYLYQNGFDNGSLIEAKFEVDEQWQPHYLVTYARNIFEGVGGPVIEKVIVVNVAKATPVINTYDLGKEPEWIERAMPLSLLSQYVTNWGYYNNDYARKNPWKTWFGFRKDGSTMPSEYDLNYTTDNHSVWVIPMTSVNNSDSSVTGVLVYETTKNEAVFFSEVRGFNTGDTVRETIAHAPVFLGKNLSVDHVQLYSIYGELTWIAIITNPQGSMKGFAGVAILHARGQNASEVVFAPNIGLALSQYRSQLAGQRNSGHISRTTEQKQLSGKVVGFGTVPGNSQLPNTWVIQVEGDPRIFTVRQDSYLKIPMVHEGDNITITYMEIEGGEAAVSGMNVERLDGAATTTPAIALEKKQ